MGQVNLSLHEGIQDDKDKGINNHLNIKAKSTQKLWKMSKKGAVK